MDGAVMLSQLELDLNGSSTITIIRLNNKALHLTWVMYRYSSLSSQTLSSLLSSSLLLFEKREYSPLSSLF